MEVLGAVAWKAAVTAVVIVTVARVAERAGPVLAAILMGMPVSIGPALTLLALTQDAEFLAHSALYATAGAVGALGFLVGYVNAAGRRWRLGLWGSLAAGYAGWFLVVAGVSRVELDVPRTLLLLAAGFLASHLLLPRLTAAPRTGVAAPWAFLVGRGLLGGLVVATVVTGAGVLGPALSGLLAGFPVVFAAAAWMLTSLGGSALAAAVLSVADRGLASYVGFCLTVHFLSGPLPGLGAVAAAVAVSVAISLALVRWRAPAR